VLAAALEKTGMPDLILTGEKATDGETGQVGPEVAALLDMPLAARVTRLDRSEGGIEFDCTLEEGVLTQRSSLPCLLTVASGVSALPLPTLAGKKAAYKKEIKTETAESLGLGADETGLAASPTRVAGIRTPKLSRNTEKFTANRPGELSAGLDRIIEILRESAVI
jgi:electron transfer flavoprotein beta subunit